MELRPPEDSAREEAPPALEREGAEVRHEKRRDRYGTQGPERHGILQSVDIGYRIPPIMLHYPSQIFI